MAAMCMLLWGSKDLAGAEKIPLNVLYLARQGDDRALMGNTKNFVSFVSFVFQSGG